MSANPPIGVYAKSNFQDDLDSALQENSALQAQLRSIQIHPDMSKRLAELEAENSALEAENASLGQRIRTVESQNSDLRGEIQYLKGKPSESAKNAQCIEKLKAKVFQLEKDGQISRGNERPIEQTEVNLDEIRDQFDVVKMKTNSAVEKSRIWKKKCKEAEEDIKLLQKKCAFYEHSLRSTEPEKVQIQSRLQQTQEQCKRVELEISAIHPFVDAMSLNERRLTIIEDSQFDLRNEISALKGRISGLEARSVGKPPQRKFPRKLAKRPISCK